MKRLVIVLGILLLAGAVAVPVLARGPGGEEGYHMMGPWGSGPYGGLTEEQFKKFDQLNQKFYNDTADLRKEVWTKSRELSDILSSAEPDAVKAKALQKEISNLKAKLADESLNYELEARKIAPKDSYGRGYGWGSGHHMWGPGPGMGYGMGYGPPMGYGWQMGGYGPPMGPGMGYGPGGCWSQ
jgi:Spy/CpxP family protein refolding chaperone